MKSKGITFDGLVEQFGDYSKDGKEFAITQFPYLDTVAGESNGYVVKGESYYFATGYDREGNPYRLIWEWTNRETEDEGEAANWDEFEALPDLHADPAPWYIDKDELTFAGWGIVGEPQQGVIITGPSGDSIDVTGYHADDYWDSSKFRGPDRFGIVPIYHTEDGTQFPAEAKGYPYLA